MSKIYPKKEVNMANCKELYLFLFNKITDAVNELEKNSGTQFDPVLVKKFVELIHEGKISIA
mgnify:CR=1 FL=1